MSSCNDEIKSTRSFYRETVLNLNHHPSASSQQQHQEQTLLTTPPKKRLSNSLQDRVQMLQSALRREKLSPFSDQKILDWTTVKQEPLNLLLSPASPAQPSSRKEKRRSSSSISFAKMTNVCVIPDESDDYYDSMYYKEEELAEFRYEAFLEKCGIADI